MRILGDKRRSLVMISFTVLLSKVREAAAKTINGSTSSNKLSKTHSEALKAALESIPVPYDGICDPNKILDQTTKENLAEKIFTYSSSLRVDRQGRVAVGANSRENGNRYESIDNNSMNEDINDAVFPIQIAVAILEEMDAAVKSSINEIDFDAEQLAGQFTMSLHNAWGIGHEILSVDGDGSIKKEINGGTGVLIFLSVRDRVVYVSVGGALSHLLTRGRINRVINDEMKADLIRAKYGQGLAKGIDAIVELLESNEEPSELEKISENWGAIAVSLWVAFAFGTGFLHGLKRKREERIYAKVSTRLSDLDRARAKALQGAMQQTTSCPICLEDFSSLEYGSDGRPIQLLRCGHTFDKTCYEKWIASGNGDITKCPVCRADVGIGRYNPPVRVTVEHSISESYHDSGHRNGSNDNDLRHEDISSFEFDGESSNENRVPTEVHVHQDEIQQVNIQYQVDRVFRLERLSELYPRYITPDAVTRWCSPTFDGSLVNDPSFRDRNPVVTTNESSKSNDSDNLSRGNGCRGGCIFDGGTSSGGAGSTF